MRHIKRVCIAVCLLMIVMSGCKSSILESPPSIAFRFSVPVQGHVTLRVENSYNTVVETAIDQEMSPGQYSHLFQTGEFTEGIYFITVEIKGTGNSGYYSNTQYYLMEKY